jgi:subtilase family serine protease
LSASQLRTAYHATGNGSAKIAVVDAFGDPNIKSDLDTYSRVMGLPVLPACTSRGQTGCFEKIDQRGGQRYPATDSGWALETALDVEAVHAVCPGCRIELVQADSDAITNLLAAVDQAVATGAQVVSMSWGGPEFAGQTANDHHFQTAGVNFVASSGDSGYGVSWPAAAGQVMAVGGTHLAMGPNGRASETVWAGAGSGCSRYEAKPAWQHDAGCARRTVADVAADADPATGAAIISSLSPSGAGWNVVGGTSLAAPLVAGLIGLAGPTSHNAVMKQLYGSVGTPRLYDVSSGRNGSCSPAYLCSSATGYDGPTGVGSPNALTAF